MTLLEKAKLVGRADEYEGDYCEEAAASNGALEREVDAEIHRRVSIIVGVVSNNMLEMKDLCYQLIDHEAEYLQSFDFENQTGDGSSS